MYLSVASMFDYVKRRHELAALRTKSISVNHLDIAFILVEPFGCLPLLC